MDNILPASSTEKHGQLVHTEADSAADMLLSAFAKPTVIVPLSYSTVGLKTDHNAQKRL